MSTVDEAIAQLKKPQESSTPEQPATEEVQEPEAQAEAPEVETEEITEASQEAKTEEVEAETETERVEIEADQFAEILNLKPDQMDVNDEGQISFKAKVDGEPIDVSLEQLINAFQGDATLTNRSKELAESKKAQETELINLQNQTQQFAQQSASLLEGLKEQFLTPFDDINWKELKEDDPGQYAAQMQDKRATEERLGQIASQAIEQISQSQESQNVELQKQYGEYLGHQKDLLTDTTSHLHVPDFEKSYPEIKSYMKSLGFNEQEQGQVADARILSAFHKAMMFDKGKEGAKKKLSKPVPKVLKPGKSPSKQEVSSDNISKLEAKLKDSGDPKDAVALLKARSK